MNKKKPLGMRIGESVFCTGYPIFAFIAAFLFAKGGNTFKQLCAIMTLLLAAGDSFHLIPRILVNIRGDREKDRELLGLGNFISSITMTLFYVLLLSVMETYHPSIEVPSFYRIALVLLTGLRIVLCLYPMGQWFDRDRYLGKHILRNVPFVAMGILTVMYLISCFRETFLAVLVIISFVCYMGTVLFAHEKPMMGMLMIPKTICYIWMIAVLLGR